MRLNLNTTDAPRTPTDPTAMEKYPQTTLLLGGAALGAAAVLAAQTLRSGRRRRRRREESQKPALAEDIRSGLEECIGNTPLIRIKCLSEATGCEILGKAEVLSLRPPSQRRAAQS